MAIGTFDAGALLSMSETHYGLSMANSKKDLIKFRNRRRGKRSTVNDSGGLTSAKDSMHISTQGSESRKL